MPIMTHSRRKTVSMLISTIGVQPTSFSLPREVFKPRAEMEIKMNSLEISPSVLETFVGMIPVQFKAGQSDEAEQEHRNVLVARLGFLFFSAVCLRGKDKHEDDEDRDQKSDTNHLRQARDFQCVRADHGAGAHDLCNVVNGTA